MSQLKTCCIVGVGNHSSTNLIPSLLKLQEEGLIHITKLLRKNILKGDEGLNVEVVSKFPTDVDFMVVCGDPELHASAIKFSNENKIPIFVEKPHLVEDSIELNNKIMIGYNFNFLPLPEEFEEIKCTTKGIYRAWPTLFHPGLKAEKYEHSFHTVFVHPLSVMITKYGKPNNISFVDNSNEDDSNDTTFTLTLHYDKGNKVIHFTSLDSNGFTFDVIQKDGVSLPMKAHKKDTYYKMLKHYVTSDFESNAHVGKEVLRIILHIVSVL